MAVPLFDLVVRWPDNDDWRVLKARRTVPVFGYPRWLRFPGGRVWIRHGTRMVFRFTIEAIDGPRKIVPIGGTSNTGYRLHVRKGTGAAIDPPVPLAAVGNWSWAWHYWAAVGFRYMRRKPREFVNTGVFKTLGVLNVPIEVAHVDSTTVGLSERIHTFAERRLVRQYAAWLDDNDRLVRKSISIPGEGTLLTDGYDLRHGLLIEAKANADRPSLRMALGQLLDYQRYLSRSKLAVLVPSRPPPDMLTLLRAQRVTSIWRDGRGFTDSAGGIYSQPSSSPSALWL